MRNLERDAIRMAERKERLLDAGFRVFSEQTIEAANLSHIIEEANVASLTLYRYYGNKKGLAMAVMAKRWSDYLQGAFARYHEQGLADRTAAEQFTFYLNEFRWLYLNDKPLLRLNENFTSYIKHEKTDEEQNQPITGFLQPLLTGLHRIYLRGEQDGSLRTELGEERLAVTPTHTLLAVVGKYASGLLYAGDDEEKNLREIDFLIDMFKHTCIRESTAL